MKEKDFPFSIVPSYNFPWITKDLDYLNSIYFTWQIASALWQVKEIDKLKSIIVTGTTNHTTPGLNFLI
jgi:hypothetical protein